MENKLLNEIEKVVHENRADGVTDKELAEAIYSLQQEVSIDFFNTMKGNSDIDEATESRFNHWALKHFKP